MSRNLKIIYIARITMSASRALAAVLVPIYFALLGLKGTQLGLIFFGVAIVSTLISTLSGMTSDRIGRKPFLIFIPLLASIAAVAFILTTNIYLLALFSMLGSFGRGAGAGAGQIGPYQPVESALAVESVESSKRNQVFGRLAFASSIGALIGSAIAITFPTQHHLVLHSLGMFKIGFLITAIGPLFSSTLAVFIKDTHQTNKQTSTETARRSLNGSNKPKFQLPKNSMWLLKRLFITNGINGLAVGMFGPFVTYWLYVKFGASVSSIGVLYTLVNIATLPSTLSAAPIAKKLGLVKTVTLVRTIQALLLIPMVLAPTYAIAGGIYLVRMVFQRIGMPLRQSYVVAMADKDERATVTALSNIPSQTANAIGPAFAGYLFDNVSLDLPFMLAAIFQLLNSGLYWIFFHKIPPQDEIDDHVKFDKTSTENKNSRQD